jgi:hypothetical protein
MSVTLRNAKASLEKSEFGIRANHSLSRRVDGVRQQRLLSHSRDEKRSIRSMDVNPIGWRVSRHKKSNRSRQSSRLSLDFTSALTPHDHIILTINDWLERNHEALKISNGKFIENEDFRLNIVSDGLATLICSCGVRVKLTKDRSTFSLSNVYKHLRSKRCATMKKKRVRSPNDEQDMDASDDLPSTEDSVSQDPTVINHSVSSASSSVTAITVATPTSSKRSGSSNSLMSHKIQRVRSWT